MNPGDDVVDLLVENSVEEFAAHADCLGAEGEGEAGLKWSMNPTRSDKVGLMEEGLGFKKGDGGCLSPVFEVSEFLFSPPRVFYLEEVSAASATEVDGLRTTIEEGLDGFTGEAEADFLDEDGDGGSGENLLKVVLERTKVAVPFWHGDLLRHIEMDRQSVGLKEVDHLAGILCGVVGPNVSDEEVLRSSFPENSEAVLTGGILEGRGKGATLEGKAGFSGYEGEFLVERFCPVTASCHRIDEEGKGEVLVKERRLEVHMIDLNGAEGLVDEAKVVERTGRWRIELISEVDVVIFSVHRENFLSMRRDRGLRLCLDF